MTGKNDRLASAVRYLEAGKFPLDPFEASFQRVWGFFPSEKNLIEEARRLGWEYPDTFGDENENTETFYLVLRYKGTVLDGCHARFYTLGTAEKSCLEWDRIYQNTGNRDNFSFEVDGLRSYSYAYTLDRERRERLEDMGRVVKFLEFFARPW